MKTFGSITGPLGKQLCHLGSEASDGYFLRRTPSLTAGFKHMWRMWHAAVQRDGAEGKSRQGKNSLREGWDKKQNTGRCKDSENSHFCPLFYEYANETLSFTLNLSWPHAWPRNYLINEVVLRMVQGEDEEVERKQHQEVFTRFLQGTHQGEWTSFNRYKLWSRDFTCIIWSFRHLQMNDVCSWLIDERSHRLILNFDDALMCSELILLTCVWLL